MSLEKPISTIRKAVKRLAEDRAFKENREKPEQKDYDDIFNTYKMLKMLNPNRLEVVIKIAAKSQELKNEMGGELFEIFNEVWTDVIKDGRIAIEGEKEKLKRTLNFSRNEFNSELKQIEERFLKVKADQVRNDSRIVDAFYGKEELLNKAIDVTISAFRELMRYKDVTKGR